MKQIIMQDSFWRNVLYAIRLTGPLVKVLRLVEGEDKLAVGYIYEAMDIAKETLSKISSIEKINTSVLLKYLMKDGTVNSISICILLATF